MYDGRRNNTFHGRSTGCASRPRGGSVIDGIYWCKLPAVHRTDLGRYCLRGSRRIPTETTPVPLAADTMEPEDWKQSPDKCGGDVSPVETF